MILAVILAADRSHLNNSMSLKRKTKTNNKKNRLALEETHSPAWVVRHLPIVQPLHMQCGQSQGK